VKIAVGSNNPVKVGAVRSVILPIWPQAQILPVSVNPGVRPMPLSDEECIAGARNRAQAALEMTGSDMGVGLEGGVNSGPVGLMLLGWVAIIDSNRREGVGGTARIPLPQGIARRVRDGDELGDVIDEILGEEDIKMRGGTVGALTSGLVLRKDAFAMAVAFALSPFLVPSFHP
jgi:inosine/xanthosine triphosphatase